jgi:hypothetical protein
MRQRVSLMRTLISQPEILLMDEPFGALDTHTKLDMHSVLLGLWERQRQTVLFVTHDLGEALTLADRIILLSARPGRVKADFKGRLPAPARCRGAARDAAIRRAVLARLALAGRGIRQEPQRMRRVSPSSGRSRSGSAPCLWEWGWDLEKHVPWLVPDLLDPYFVSKPSAIFQQFLSMSCLVGRDGNWTFRRGGRPSPSVWAGQTTTSGSPPISRSRTRCGALRPASASGFVLGPAAWRSDRLSEIFYPYITAFNSIPRIALAPIIILAFGIGDASKVVTRGWSWCSWSSSTPSKARARSTATTSTPPGCSAPANGR